MHTHKMNTVLHLPADVLTPCVHDKSSFPTESSSFGHMLASCLYDIFSNAIEQYRRSTINS